MIYAPHTLQIKVVKPLDKDEFGRPIPGTGGESWVDVCKCRCDDIGVDKKISINGIMYDYKHKIVYDKSSKAVTVGVEARCLNPDGSLRGSGITKNPVEKNYLPYREVWLE